jgi:hypothetical protein
VPTFRTGTVVDVVDVSGDGVQQLSVDVDGTLRRAVLYPRWASPAHAGDRVVVNTTAVDLGLGTGGVDFVVWNAAVDSYESSEGGHIMKLRYTPAQCDVLAVEEQGSPHHATMADARTLDDVPVVATSLHSQLLPVLCGLRRNGDVRRIAYVMTDGAALEAGFSNTLRAMHEHGWLCGVITSGHAVGGDYEAVTLHSGLLAAKHVLDADVIVAGLGPGVVGTATPFGTTALELGTIALAAQSLGGRAVVCVRLSEADPRERHRGLSHHVVAALGWVSSGIDRDRSCVVAPSGWGAEIAEALPSWRVVERDAGDIAGELAAAAPLGMSASHMGRTPDEDRLFFDAAAAAGDYAGTLASGR